MFLWVRAVAGEGGYDVEVCEPDVSPLAVQGPKAEDVVAGMFGESIRKIKYFGCIETSIEGIPLVLCRSGWSKQGGFELFLRDGSRGGQLWELVKAAGKAYDIGPGITAPSGTAEGLVAGGDIGRRGLGVIGQVGRLVIGPP